MLAEGLYGHRPREQRVLRWRQSGWGSRDLNAVPERTTNHVPLNLFPKSFHVLRGSITQRLSKVPPRALAQLAAAPTHALARLARTRATLGKRQRVLTLDRLPHVPHALADQLARRPALQPARQHVPPRGARGHLEPQVARAVDELEHRVRRVVARAVAELVYARVAAWALRVARSERLEDLGRERGLEEEACGFFPRGVRAFLPQRDDLARQSVHGATLASLIDARG